MVWTRLTRLLVSALIAFPLAGGLSGCGRAAASMSYNPLARLESSDGRWVYFVVKSERRSYFGKNVIDHRLAQGEDFTRVEGVDNLVHRGWAQAVGFIEAACFIPVVLLVQFENLVGKPLPLPLDNFLAFVINGLLYPVDWVLHDIPVSICRFLWPTSVEGRLRPPGSRPLVVATLRYPATPNSFVYFLWPWFQPGYAARGEKDGRERVEGSELEIPPGRGPASVRQAPSGR